MATVNQEQRVKKLKKTLDTRLAGLFGEGRKYVIIGEVSPQWLESKGFSKLKTPLGNKGSNGWLVSLMEGPEVDPENYSVNEPEGESTIRVGKDGRQWFFIGAAVVKKANAAYPGCIVTRDAAES